MVYKVHLTSPAERDAYAAYERISEAAPAFARRWLQDLFKAIHSLEMMPARCPIVLEADELGVSIRHLIYGKRSSVYRIIFDIQDDSAEGPRVRVLRIWHGSKDRLRAEDLEGN